MIFGFLIFPRLTEIRFLWYTRTAQTIERSRSEPGGGLRGVAPRVDDARGPLRGLQQREVLRHEDVAAEAVQQEAVEELVDEARGVVVAGDLLQAVHGGRHEAHHLPLVLHGLLHDLGEGVQRGVTLDGPKRLEGLQVDPVDLDQLGYPPPILDPLDPPARGGRGSREARAPNSSPALQLSKRDAASG